MDSTENSGISLELVSKTNYPAILSGIEVTTDNVAGVADPTVDLELSADGGSSWTVIDRGLPTDHFGRGSYLWTATPETDTALVRVVTNDASQLHDTSDEPFLIANGGTDYYVNEPADPDLSDNEYTTAAGDNAHGGKSPNEPMARRPTKPITNGILLADIRDSNLAHVGHAGHHALPRASR